MYFLYFVKWAEFHMKIDEINKKIKEIYIIIINDFDLK